MNGCFKNNLGMGANVELYHAGLSLKLRTEAHKKFTNDECEVGYTS